MSDQSNGPRGEQGEGGASPEGGQLLLERLYLKDASFESPRSPTVFTEDWRPEFKLDINTRTSGLGEDRYEVVLSGTLKALAGEKTCYIVEIQQAGVFRVANVEPETLRRVLGTVCPATLFPYLRETVDSLVVKGAFPAVHLAPVNFDALFDEAMRRQAEQAH